ncbi:hypothetical protein ACJX0J_009775 [Zea mays]
MCVCGIVDIIIKINMFRTADIDLWAYILTREKPARAPISVQIINNRNGGVQISREKHFTGHGLRLQKYNLGTNEWIRSGVQETTISEKKKKEYRTWLHNLYMPTTTNIATTVVLIVC